MKLNLKIGKLLLGFGIIAVMIFVFVMIEFYESRKELLKTLENEAVNLTQSLSLSFENTINSNNEFENLLTDKLNATALLISKMDLLSKSFSSELNELIEQFHIENVAVINTQGITNQVGKFTLTEISPEFFSKLQPLFQGDYEWLNLGMSKPDNINTKYVFARLNGNNRVILISFSTEYILNYRKQTGIGAQIQKIALSKNIEYIVLQDEDGILSASKGVNELSSVEADEFLQNVYKTTNTLTRMLDFQGRKIYEGIKTLNLKDNSKIILRVALSTAEIRSVQQRSMIRVIIIGIGVFVLLSIIYFYFLARQGLSELKVKHRKISDYTDAVLENMADAVIAADSEGSIVYFNRAASEITKLPADSVSGKQLAEVFSSNPSFLQLIKSTETSTQELTYTNAENQQKVINTNISHTFNEAGLQELKIIIINDLTDMKNYQEQLMRKEKLTAMGELAAGVAHEIRNPLNSINIIAQRIQREFKPAEKSDEFNSFMFTIRSEISRVNDIIKQFLEFAKPKKLLLIEADISQMLDETIALFESEINLKKIEISKNYLSLPTLLFDRDKMKQVFINIFRNSIDAVSKDGKIECKLESGNGKAIITIEDNGSGIDNENLTKIFNLYFTTKSAGTGLGLSIVNQIINEHNGNIRIISEVNEGTQVIIELPSKS